MYYLNVAMLIQIDFISDLSSAERRNLPTALIVRYRACSTMF